MRRGRAVRALAGPATIAVLALAVGGCAAAVEVPPPDPLPEGAAAFTCASYKGRLPAEVLSQTTTAVRPTSSFTAAWGDPAIVSRCGVPTPAALQPTSQLLTVNGVDWLPEQLERGYVFTTVGRAVNVEVSVPDAYAPESGALADLSDAVTATVPLASTPSPTPSTSSS